MKLPLVSRTAIITGANQGLGKAIALAYVEAGANVVLCARGEAALEKVAQDLRSLQRGSVVALPADVANEADVKHVVHRALTEFDHFEILVNNAAIHGPKGPIDDVDWRAWVEAINVNLLGSVCFARHVVPHFKSRNYGKIVQLSGGGATKPFAGLSAYAASKAAIVRFAETLALEVREHHIDVNSIAPGALNTRLLEDVLEAGPSKVGADYHARARRQLAEGGTPLDVPARLAVFLGSSRSDGITGKLISAVWDDWESFPEHLQDLGKSDVYTLRRIVAKDRGFDWGDK